MMWSCEVEGHGMATMIGTTKGMPDGSSLALVTYGELPHALPGFTVEVWALVVRSSGSEAWRELGRRGARADFGALDAQTWRDRFVDRAWERARGAET